MFRAILLICCVLLFGCAADEIDVGHLNQHDKKLFQIAADKEGVLVVENSYPSAWWIQRGELKQGKRGQNNQDFMGTCQIIISSNLDACSNGGVDQRFIMVARHEIRHCQGDRHSEDPEDLMYKTSPCELKDD